MKKLISNLYLMARVIRSLIVNKLKGREDEPVNGHTENFTDLTSTVKQVGPAAPPEVKF